MKLSALLVTLSSIAAFAQEAAPEQQPSAIGSFLPLILLFVVMWLFFIRPKNKEMKKMDFFKGHHAGNTQEEMLIDISAYNV